MEKVAWATEAPGTLVGGVASHLKHPLGGRVSGQTGEGDPSRFPSNEEQDLAPGRPHRLEAKQDSRLLVTMVKPSDAAAWNALAPQGRTIDLRHTPRERRHSTIFYAFDRLSVGESFLLVNDHDPQPLRAQMEQLRPSELTWEYEVRGPNEFRIKISRVAISTTPQPETVMAGCNH